MPVLAMSLSGPAAHENFVRPGDSVRIEFTNPPQKASGLMIIVDHWMLSQKAPDATPSFTFRGLLQVRGELVNKIFETKTVHTPFPPGGPNGEGADHTLTIGFFPPDETDATKEVKVAVPVEAGAIIEHRMMVRVLGMVGSKVERFKATSSIAVCELSAVRRSLDRPQAQNLADVAVTERVELEATGNHQQVSWALQQGGGALSANTGSKVTYTARELEAGDPVRIELTDADGCALAVSFNVRCNTAVTRSRIQAIFTRADAARVAEITQAFNEAFALFDLDTCTRRAHFFAQVLKEVETAGLPRAESLSYTPEQLMATFSYFRQHPAEAQQFGRTPQHPANQPAIGNRAYANRNGNGDIASGDGYAFRGRGYLQITGRGNYRSVQEEIDRRFQGSGVNILTDPDSATQIRAGMIAAMAFWTLNNINTAADRGLNDATVDRVTDRINPGEGRTGRNRRQHHFHNTVVVFRASDCPRRPGAP